MDNTDFENLLKDISSVNDILENSDVPNLLVNVGNIFDEEKIKEIVVSARKDFPRLWVPLNTIRHGSNRFERAKKLSMMMKEQSNKILETYFANKCRIDKILGDEAAMKELMQLGLMVYACCIELHEAGTSGSGWLYRLMGKEHDERRTLHRLIDYTEKRGYVEECQKLKEALVILKEIYFQVHDYSSNPTNYLCYMGKLSKETCKLFEGFYRENLLSYEMFSQLKEAFDKGRLKDDDMAWGKYSRSVGVTSIVQ